MKKTVFQIFIAGHSDNSLMPVNTFRVMCNQFLKPGTFEIIITDVLKETEVAEKYKILAIPTIIKVKPHTEKRIIGDTRDVENAKKAFDFLMAK